MKFVRNLPDFPKTVIPTKTETESHLKIVNPACEAVTHAQYAHPLGDGAHMSVCTEPPQLVLEPEPLGHECRLSAVLLSDTWIRYVSEQYCSRDFNSADMVGVGVAGSGPAGWPDRPTDRHDRATFSCRTWIQFIRSILWSAGTAGDLGCTQLVSRKIHPSIGPWIASRNSDTLAIHTYIYWIKGGQNK